MYPYVNAKQSFFDLEIEVSAYWKENNIFQKSINARPKENPYRFYDGPPFITGTPHYGSLLSSVVKDTVGRYWTMQGKRVERVWGWDCHGLPIEEKVQKKLNINSNKEVEKVGVKKFIDECYNYTAETSAEWDWYIERIGRWVDMSRAYRTMDQDYMESVMWVFSQLYTKGYVYEGKRVSLYSWKLGTPISNFEVAMDDSYQEVNDPAIMVKFDLSQNGAKWENTSILAWTTTPWTMPANMAIAIRKDIEYTRVQLKSEVQEGSKESFYIVAKNRADYVFKGKGEYEIMEEISGAQLIGLAYTPPFPEYYNKKHGEKNHCIYHADFITDIDGTGVGHEAPEFGEVDFELAKANGIHITHAMDEEGKYTSEISDLTGTFYQDANQIIMNRLQERKLLFKKESITHRVPFCPRSGTPLIQKAQKSWFIDIQNNKEKLLEANKQINWSPDHLKYGRFAKGVAMAPDWCISRTRYWGTPMPVWIGYDTKGMEQDRKVFGSKKEIEAVSGMKIENLHKPYIDDITWEKDGLTYKRIPEVLDVWMDSGSMPYAQMHYPFENSQAMEASFPADFISEYTGQVRAWFYVMHVLGVLLMNKPAFTNVITTGTIYGTDGRKMSKSFKNYPDPRHTIEKYGADPIRFYLLSSPLLSGGDADFSEEGISDAIKGVMLPLWNVYVFFTTYANIDGFEPKEKDYLSYLEQGTESQSFFYKNTLDTWIIYRLNGLVGSVTSKFESYDLQSATREVLEFIDDLTNWYIRRSRRRFWKSGSDTDKTNAYETLYQVLVTLSKILAPITPFISESIYRGLTNRESVHLEDFPKNVQETSSETLDKNMIRARQIITLGLGIRGMKKIRVRQPLSSIMIGEGLPDYFIEIICDELNVKNVKVENMQHVARKICKPHAKLIGPKFGKDVQKIIQEAKSGNFVELPDGKIQIDMYTLESDEYEMAYEPLPDIAMDVLGGFGMIVALDTEITEELKLEGIARDIVRMIQDARKEGEFDVSERIRISVSGNNIDGALEKFTAYITEETLSSIEKDIIDEDFRIEKDGSDGKILFKLKRL